MKTVKIVALNSDIGAAVALLTEANPRFFAIAACEGEDAFTTVREALAEGEGAYLSASGEAVSERLAKALAAIKEVLQKAENVRILPAATVEDESGTAFYLLGQKSDLSAYLVRGESFTNLCPSTEEPQLISGVLKESDRVILTTETLMGLLGEGQQILKDIPLERLEDEIDIHLPEAENFPVAAVVVEVEKTQQTELKPIEKAGVPGAPVLTFSFSFRTVLSFITRLFKRAVPRSKRGAAVLGVLLFLVLITGIVLTYKSKKEAETSAAFKKSFETAFSEYNKARSLKDLDAAGASTSLNTASAELASALKIYPKDSQALELKKTIDETSGEILRVFQVSDLPLWLDLGFIKERMTSTELSLSLGKLLLLDDGKKVLAMVDLKNKSQQILSGGEKLGEAKWASLNGNVAWVFSADKGVIRVDGKSQASSAVIKPDSSWGEIRQIYGFAGNVYLMDAGSNQIWKYLPVEGGYSEKRAYFKEGVKVNLSGVKRLHIDSSVWVLSDDGLAKYTQGSLDFFSPSGLDKPWQNPRSFFVSDRTDYLYLLDSGNDRMLVLDKKGVYQAQYQSDKLGGVSDLVVDEEGKQAYFLEGSKIYSLELK